MKLSFQVSSTRTTDEWLAFAHQADDYGFAEIHLADRLDFHFPTWPTLFAMARHTQRILLGTGVTNPYLRHPVLAAKLLSLLDEESGGRAVLGLGMGSVWHYQMLGITELHAYTTLREAVTIIRRLTAGGAADFEGQVFSATADFAFPWQPTREHIPVFIGTRSPGVMGIAGEVADELHLPFCIAHEFVKVAQGRARAGMTSAGREGDLIPISAGPLLCIAEDRDAALRDARLRLPEYIAFMKYPCEVMGIPYEDALRLHQAWRERDEAYMLQHVTDQMIAGFTLAGAPADIIKQIERLHEIGLSHLTLNEPGPDLVSAVDLLGGKVLPHFL